MVANLTLPYYLRRRTKYISAISVFILIAFSVFYASMLWGHYPLSQNKIKFTLKQRNGTDSRRLTKEQVNNQYHQQQPSRQFRIQSGFFPVSHPSNPYFVKIDGTGANLETTEYGHEDHPLSRLADLREPRDVKRESVFFFVVPKANGGKIKAIMTNCFNVRRSEKLEEPESTTYIGGVLNIDTQTLKGLAKARSNHIIDSGLVDVFATSYFFEGLLLFKTEHKGRAFTILQHPVYRAESLYLSRDASLKKLDLLDYLESPNYIDNWIVRSLTNDRRGDLTEEHLLVAQGILAQKFFVGFVEHFEETIKRLEIYYQWGESNNHGCVANHLKKVEEEITPHVIGRGSSEWNLVTVKDNFDMMLYYYALELFAKQGSTMFHRPYVDKTGKPIDFTELKKKEMLKKKLLRQFLGT